MTLYFGSQTMSCLDACLQEPSLTTLPTVAVAAAISAEVTVSRVTNMPTGYQRAALCGGTLATIYTTRLAVPTAPSATGHTKTRTVELGGEIPLCVDVGKSKALSGVTPVLPTMPVFAEPPVPLAARPPF